MWYKRQRISKGQDNFSVLFILVSCAENGYYRVVSVAQLSFDCRSHCGLSHRMQGHHSERKTLVKKLKASIQPLSAINSVTGHTNERSFADNEEVAMRMIRTTDFQS